MMQMVKRKAFYLRSRGGFDSTGSMITGFGLTILRFFSSLQPPELCGKSKSA